jgi:hypothetical protein
MGKDRFNVIRKKEGGYSDLCRCVHCIAVYLAALGDFHGGMQTPKHILISKLAPGGVAMDR